MRGSTGRAGAGPRDTAPVDASILADVRALVADTLGLGSTALSPETRLLGHMIELDSMAVVAIIMALEERYGFVVHDAELSSSVFDTIETLARFVDGKRAS